MWISTRWYRSIAIAATLIALVCALWFGSRAYSAIRVEIALAKCQRSSGDVQIECIFHIIDSELRRSGVGSAMNVFSRAYEQFPNFADGGCHTRAHRVGDMAYYELFVDKENLDAIDFPQETTACGYGFFHGFLEHYTQDHPTVAHVTQTCDYLIKRLASSMSDIEMICYHGSGHGFTLAQSEHVKKSDWGTLAAFVTWPASQCRALPEASASDIEQCYEGIFNIMVDYMVTNQYGFHYDKVHPFAVCAVQPQALQRACMYEMAQKLDSISNYKPATMIRMVSVIARQSFRMMAFEVGITGVIQQVVATTNGYSDALNSCSDIPEPYYSSCVKAIAWGLYEHGDPQQEYKKVLAFCAEPSIALRGDTELCYERAATRLPRFYTSPKIASICPEFPADYQHLCTDQLTLRQGYGDGGSIIDPKKNMSTMQ